MIPKNAKRKELLTMRQAEDIIDSAIVETSEDVIHVDVFPIAQETMDAVRLKYQTGQWSVHVSPLRTPNGYRVALS